MKVFISWSGALSQKVALLLHGWIPHVIQAVDTYLSTESVDKGDRWLTHVGKNLDEASYGVLCVTRDNVDSPWLNFEAGALSKNFEENRVSPFLFGVDESDIEGPLQQFQATRYQEEDVRKLIHSINRSCNTIPSPILGKRRAVV